MRDGSESIHELDAAIAALAAAGGFDRDQLTRGITRIVERQATFQSLRSRFDPRFTAPPKPAVPGPSSPR
jgi:hypothetical protein